MKHALLLLSALIISACTVSEPVQPTLSRDLRQSAVVSTSAPNFQPQPGDTVAWRDNIAVHAPDGAPINSAIVDEIRANLDANLVNKGYQFAQAGAEPRYWIQGVIVLGNQLNETQLRDVLGFEPGLVAHSQQYEKGSLLLLLVDPNSQMTQWRAVVQVFTDAELPKEVRSQRLEYITRSLIRPLPTLSQPTTN